MWSSELDIQVIMSRKEWPQWAKLQSRWDYKVNSELMAGRFQFGSRTRLVVRLPSSRAILALPRTITSLWLRQSETISEDSRKTHLVRQDQRCALQPCKISTRCHQLPRETNRRLKVDKTPRPEANLNVRSGVSWGCNITSTKIMWKRFVEEQTSDALLQNPRLIPYYEVAQEQRYFRAGGKSGVDPEGSKRLPPPQAREAHR